MERDALYQTPQEKQHAILAVIIESKVRRLKWKQNEAEELAQELWLRVLPRLPLFDPARGSFITFGRIVVGNTLKSLLSSQWKQKRKAAQRGVGTFCTAHSEEDDETEVWQPADPDILLAQYECREDMSDVLGTLTAEESKLIDPFLKEPDLSIKDCARNSEQSYDSVRRGIHRLRTRLEETGLKDYFHHLRYTHQGRSF
jgi:RNA polymerase sigma factor (sigma-70 family)